MSELPNIDPLKVAQLENEKLERDVKVLRNRESQLEVLAQALLDQRNELQARLDAIPEPEPVVEGKVV